MTDEAKKQELLKRLADGVLNFEEDDVVAASNEVLELGFDAYEGIMEGLAKGMNEAGRLWEERVTDVMVGRLGLPGGKASARRWAAAFPLSYREDFTAETAADAFLRTLGSPTLVDVTLDTQGLPIEDIYPRKLPDLTAGAPLLLTGRFTGPVEGDLVIPVEQLPDALNKSMGQAWREREANQKVLDAQGK